MNGLRPAGVLLADVDPSIRRRPLPARLLRTVLVDLRLSTIDVELLSGRPMRAVRRDAEEAAVQVPALPPGVTAEDLRAAHLDNAWSQARICQELGIPGRRSLFTLLDDCGIPRTERANPWDTRARRSPG